MANGLSATCIALLAFAIAPAAPADEIVYPALQEPRHRPVLHDDRFDVYDVQLSGGEQSFYHRHERDQLGIVMSTSTSYNQQLGGAEIRTTADRGTISYIPHSTLGGYTHRVRIEPGNQFRVIGIEFAKSAGAQGKRLVLLPGQSRLAFPQGTIARVEIPPRSNLAVEGDLLVAMSSGSLAGRGSRWDFSPGDVKPISPRPDRLENPGPDTVAILVLRLAPEAGEAQDQRA
ncbi:hypothetical protein ACFB49_06610 [Sphingomonas sp. DBB INV C78]|uniref:hypothetical protein n=1 Tax=Sphingomonas sp. DBB INV C78 TaxID=3349434 RepID=UPI0036D24B85